MRDEIYCGGLISEEYLEHFGRAHDENPPGRGSGRFAYGSGKQPHQNHDDDPKPKKHRSSVVSKKASRKHSENESEEDKEKNSAKESQLKAAREKGEYDLDFMEVISNDSVFEDNNEKEMLKEYSKYLDDPDKWMQTFDSTDYHKKKVAKYKASHSDVSDEELSHSSGPWKKHKYIRKEGDRYIYSNAKTKSNKLVEGAKKVGEAGLNVIANAIDNAQDVGYSIRRHDELVKMRKERGEAFTNTGRITEEEAEELDRRVQKPKSIRESSIFFKKKDGDKHLVNRPLSRKKRVTESNSVGVRRRKKYGSTLTGRR